MGFQHVSTDTSITVVVDGKSTTITSDAPNFRPLRQAIRDNDEDAVRANLSVSGAVENWSKGNFKLNGNQALYKGEEIPGELGRRIVQMASNGESPEPLVKFWEKLQRNPSMRSVEQLYPFLKHEGIPIIANGNFLAYKGIKSNYTDAHTGKVDNKPGAVCEMPRNKVSDDPRTSCHYGFHVGALEYARSFSQVTVVCEVDPGDVVCIPYDNNQQKMRVCKYRVRGNHNGELLPSTSYDLEEDLGRGAEIQQEEEEFDLEIEEAEDEDLKEMLRLSKELSGTVDRMTNQLDADDAERAARILAEKEKPKTKKPPKERRLKEARAEEKTARLKVAPKFKKIHRMERRELLDQGIMELREYAGQVLHIVGASKIPGGKVPLVNQIIRVRRNFA